MSVTRRQFLAATAAGVAAPAALASIPAPAEAAMPASPAPETDAPGMLRVGLMQMLGAGFDAEANLRKLLDGISRAAAARCDIAMPPEMFNIGYMGPMTPDAEEIGSWRARATPVDGPWIGAVRDAARRHRVAVLATFLEQVANGDTPPRNSALLIDRDGRDVLRYSKVHTTDFGLIEAACEPGDHWPVATLETASGPVQAGCMICYDREFPESARSLMLGGAEIILTPNACLLDDIRLHQFQARAHENACACFMTNYPAPFKNGRSVAYGVGGEPLAEAGPEECLLVVGWDLAGARAYRKMCIWGDAFRRPHRYGMLTQDVKLPEFQRIDAWGRPYDRNAR